MALAPFNNLWSINTYTRWADDDDGDGEKEEEVEEEEEPTCLTTCTTTFEVAN